MRNVRLLFLGFALLLGNACSYELEKKEAPKDLIPQDTFTMVLQEVMVVESYFKHQQHNVSAYHESLPKAINPIFEKYNVDSARYSSSMDYYAAHQEKLIKIYNQIQDSLVLETADYVE